LVALVALGSATFAWYITNARVDASQTQFSAASADGLVIRHGTSGDWSNKITDLATAESLTPGAFNYNVATPVYATGEGTSFTDGTLNGNLTELTGNDIAGAFLLDTFYVASSGASAVEAKMYVTCSTVSNTYLNIAIFVDGVLQEVLTSDSTATSTGKITSSTGAAPVAYTAGGQSLTAMSNHQVTNVDTSKDTFTATVKGTGESGCKVQIVAFVDGFNPACKNSTANITAATVDYYFTT
ncbi:MAG: hypothetical protein Q3975_07355, partial [Oscillospiraceae bacterium]|nr:hypothetical protein [Oscillospiraceae bacterium]